MNWISNVVPPKIRSFLRRETPENLWVKCPDSGELVFHKDLEQNLFVVPSSGYHMRIPVKARLDGLFDDARYTVLPSPDVPADPLKFRDMKRYSDRLKEYRTKTNETDAIKLASGAIEGVDVVVAVQNFDFIAGSLGMAAGEAIIAGMTAAIDRRVPFIIFTASGGARMQEGIFSLMQMPRTTLLVQRLRAARLPYIVVLTNPTTGGVTASYAMLGDIHIAEPGAVIGFAGARVIEATIRERLPEGFQRAEYLREHGMVDMVVPRKDHRATLARLCLDADAAAGAKGGGVMSEAISSSAKRGRGTMRSMVEGATAGRHLFSKVSVQRNLPTPRPSSAPSTAFGGLPPPLRRGGSR